jgi:peptide/nickel transport system substrate-binding protein
MTARRTRSARVAAALAAVLVSAACSGGGGGGGDAKGTGEPSSVSDATSDATSDAGATPSEVPDDDADVAAIGASDGPVDVTLAPVTDEEPVSGGTLRIALEADVNGLNPTTSSLSSPGQMMAGAVFDTLAAWTTDGEAVPYLAESFTPSDDLRSWTVTLRPGIVFHDGTPVNADAVIASFEAQRTSPLVGLAVQPFFPTEGAVEKIDDLSVRFHLTEPHRHFPTYVTGQLGMVASPTWLAAAQADPTLNQQPVGTGPFRFDSRSEDSVTRFIRNDGWWKGPVYLDAVEFYPVPDPDSATDLLLGGELEGLQLTNPGSIVRLIEADGIQNVLDDAGDETFTMMNTSVPPFDDLRARQALAWATPRAQYAQLIGLDVLRQATQRFIPESPYFDPALTQPGDDPAQAAALAAEYCAEHGDDANPVTGTAACTGGKIAIEYQVAGPSVIGTRIADLLVSGWSAAFDVTVTEVFQDELIQNAALGSYNAVGWRQFGAIDPAGDNIWLLCRTIGPISINWPRYCDAERDALLVQAQAEADPVVRAQLYQQVERRINEAATYVFLTHTMWDNAFASHVRGICGRTSPDGVLLECSQSGVAWFDSAWLAT